MTSNPKRRFVVVKRSELKARSASTKLPSVLVVSCLSFLDTARDLLSALSTCKAWRAVSAERLESLFKTLYLHSFERESATDSCIAIAGDATAWKQRFMARARVEQRWRANTFNSEHYGLRLPATRQRACSPMSRNSPFDSRLA